MGRTGSGVEVRASSIRVTWTDPDGAPRRETLTVNGRPMAPTPANVKYAHRVAAEIKDHARHGTLVLSDYFPDSKHAGHGHRLSLCEPPQRVQLTAHRPSVARRRTGAEGRPCALDRGACS